MTRVKQVGGDHYAAEYQHWDYCSQYLTHPLVYAATKYMVRYRKKNGKEDLMKAVSYLEKYLSVAQIPVEIKEDDRSHNLWRLLGDDMSPMDSVTHSLLSWYHVPEALVRASISIIKHTIALEYPS